MTFEGPFQTNPSPPLPSLPLRYNVKICLFLFRMMFSSLPFKLFSAVVVNIIFNRIQLGRVSTLAKKKSLQNCSHAQLKLYSFFSGHCQFRGMTSKTVTAIDLRAGHNEKYHFDYKYLLLNLVK